MIKRIQRKFILTSSLVLLGVFTLLFSIFSIVSYSTIDKKAGNTIDVIIENGGHLPFLDNIPEDIISPEFLYETRYFTVFLSESNDAYIVNIDKISAISKDEAIKITKELILINDKSGYIDNYKFKSKEFDEGIMYVFLDCSRNLAIFKSTIFTGVGISLLAILVIFICFILFSTKVIKPFNDNLNKQKEFITNASHELKTPLSIIKASSEVMEIENGKSEWTDTINEQIVKLTNLTENLVFLSRMDENKGNLNFKEFSLSETTIEISESFEPISKTQNSAYTISIDNGITYNGDESLIGQLISILLDNAFKYSGDNGFVEIALNQLGKDIVLTVKNSAEGIKAGNLDKYFDRFYREDSARNSSVSGFGIGLSIAKAIVTSHKGKITAKSLDGKSVEFTVTL